MIGILMSQLHTNKIMSTFFGFNVKINVFIKQRKLPFYRLKKKKKTLLGKLLNFFLSNKINTICEILRLRINDNTHKVFSTPPVLAWLRTWVSAFGLSIAVTVVFFFGARLEKFSRMPRG